MHDFFEAECVRPGAAVEAPGGKVRNGAVSFFGCRNGPSMAGKADPLFR